MPFPPLLPAPSDHSHTPGCRVHKISSEPAGCSQGCQQVQSHCLAFKCLQGCCSSQLPEPPITLPRAARAPGNPLPPKPQGLTLVSGARCWDRGKCNNVWKPKWRVTSRSQPTDCPLVLMSLAPSESWDLWKARGVFRPPFVPAVGTIHRKKVALGFPQPSSRIPSFFQPGSHQPTRLLPLGHIQELLPRGWGAGSRPLSPSWV